MSQKVGDRLGVGRASVGVCLDKVLESGNECSGSQSESDSDVVSATADDAREDPDRTPCLTLPSIPSTDRPIVVVCLNAQERDEYTRLLERVYPGRVESVPLRHQEFLVRVRPAA